MTLETLTAKQSDRLQSSNVGENLSRQNQTAENTTPGAAKVVNASESKALAQTGVIPEINLVDGANQKASSDSQGVNVSTGTKSTESYDTAVQHLHKTIEKLTVDAKSLT